MKLLLVFAVAACAFAGPINRTLWEYEIAPGNTAFPGKFPYQISIRRYGRHFCGGSILDKNTILTAAHCINGEPSERLSIVAGTIYLNEGGDSYSVSRYIIHEKYNPATITDDIAVIKLTIAMVFTRYVKSIVIDNSIVPSGTITIFSGWGDNTDPGSVVNDLLFVNGEVIDPKVYQNKLATSNYSSSDSNIFVVSKYTMGYCLGDSGGPLVRNQKQIGVSSWLAECAMDYPDVHSRISYYYNWIKTQQTKSN